MLHIYFTGLAQHLQKHGFTNLQSDQCLYQKGHPAGKLLIGITTDDFLVSFSNDALIDSFRDTLALKYKVRELGSPTSYLGWSIARHGNGPVHISQPHLIDKAVTKAGLTDANPRCSPLPRNPNLDYKCTTPSLTKTQHDFFQSLIGDLRYLADSTRMDIAFATSRLARHTNAPTDKHFELLKHVLRYLKRTSTHGILHSKITTDPLRTYCDADFAESADRRSTSGSIHTIFGAPVQWSSMKHPVISLSTCEAGYI